MSHPLHGTDIDERLLAALIKLDARSNEAWMSMVGSRKKAEAEFHDQSHEVVPKALRRDHERKWSNSKYYRTAAASKSYLDKWMRDHVRGQVVLDYACGNGVFGLRAAAAGAKLVIGLDISRHSIENSRSASESQGFADSTFFVQGDCEDTGLPSNSVDVVLCGGVLHHLDLSFAFPELRRIMKPGAVLLAAEALNYNPLLKLYRRYTPHLRTDFEADHILSHNDLRFAERFFDIQNVRYFHLFSLLTVPFLDTRFFCRALKYANRVDDIVLKIWPVSYLAWQVYFELVKRQED